MAVMDAKVLYYREDGTIVTITMADVLDISVRRTAEVKNNSCDITLKNGFVKMVGSRPRHRWVKDDGSLVFKTPRKIGVAALNEPEKVEVFAKRMKNPLDVVDTSQNSFDKLFTGFITELEGEGNVTSTKLRLKLTDRNSILLNKNGVGIYLKPIESGTITSVTSTTITDSAQSWTVDQFIGRIVLLNKGGVEYRYTITSNTDDTLTVKPDDDVSGDGLGATDDFQICWTSPSILRDVILTTREREGATADLISAKFDFEDSERRQITAVGNHSVTVSGSALVVNSLRGRYGHITSGTAKGKGFSIKSNTADTITFYGDSVLSTLGIAIDDYFTIAGADSGIETIRPDGSSYPAITFSKAFKPIYEWCEELSQVEQLNTGIEIDTTDGLVCQIPAVYHIDPRNIFFWFYPSSETAMEIDASTSEPIGQDDTSHFVKSRKVKNKVKDNINFIIYRYKDFDGIELLDYVFDPMSGAPTVQDCYRPYYTVSNVLIQNAFVAGEIDSEDYGATITFAYSVPTNKFPSWWNEGIDSTETAPANDSDYKRLFEKAVIAGCKRRAWSEMNKSGNGRWEGDISLDFEPIQVNELVKYTDYALGVPGVDMRIKDVTYQIRRNSYRSNIKFEEDLDPYVKDVS